MVNLSLRTDNIQSDLYRFRKFLCHSNLLRHQPNHNHPQLPCLLRYHLLQLHLIQQHQQKRMVQNHRSSSFLRRTALRTLFPIKITWSGGVSLSFTASASSPSLVFLNSSLLIIGNFSSDSYPNSNISIFNRFNVVAPKSSRPFTITATTYYTSGSDSYGIDSKTNTYSCSVGALTPASIAINNTGIGATSKITITITLGHAIYANGYIGVTFPNIITSAIGSTCSTNITSIACSVTNSSYSNLTVSATVAASTNIFISYNSVNNPGQASTSGSFVITTYLDNLLDGIIDTLNSGLTLTFGANALSNNSMFVLPSNLTTQAPSNYTISVSLANTIPAGGSITIVFPSSISLASPALIDASFSFSSCLLSQSGNNITLTQCFASDLTSLSIYMIFSGLTNPYSTAPTSSFQLFTFGLAGNINYLLNGPTVTMTSLAVSDSFTLSRTSTEVHALTTYTFSITFYSSPSSGSYLLLDFPSGMTAINPTCTPLSGIASLSCSVVNSTSLKVNLVAVPAKTISFTVSNIQNY